MKLFNTRGIQWGLLLIILVPYVARTENIMSSVEVKNGQAEVTFLEGRATLIKKGVSLSQGDLLGPGDRVRTGKDSRIEVKLPEGSFIRFGEQTTFELISASFDQAKTFRDIKVRMVLGKIWANISKLFGGRGRFEVLTKTAVSGVRGTVYRVNVNPDDSVMVKVYWGEIVVNRLNQANFTSQSEKITKPSKVLGPHPVPGPHPVTMEEWTYIVKALQQINIRPDGTATKPFRFSIKDDLNDWVRWNQARDNTRGVQ
jgi:ferric-dicitrate binding protein FerR (iron transport regulator)